MLRGRIWNHSSSQTYRIVKPIADGQEHGIHPRATLSFPRRSTPATWTNRNHYPNRSGYYPNGEPDWRRQIHSLKPGEAMDFELGDLHADFRSQGQSRVEPSLTYSYRAVPVRPADEPRGPFKPEYLGDMRHVPPFDLRSEPLILAIEHPLRVAVRRLRDVELKEGLASIDLASLCEIEITNESGQPFELSTLKDPCRLRSLEIPPSTVLDSPIELARRIILQPGETLNCMEAGLIGEGQLFKLAYHTDRPSDRSIRLVLTRNAWAEELRVNGSEQ